MSKLYVNLADEYLLNEVYCIPVYRYSVLPVYRDTVNLAGGDEVEVFLRFRDFPGPWVFHCHNIEHEDHFMMARYDVE